MAINPMQAPIDYLGQMGIRPTDPGTALLEGLQIGAVFKQQRQAREQALKAEAFNAAASEFYRNPTLEGARNLQANFPEYAAQFQGMTKDLTAEQRMGEATYASQILTAIRSGQTETAQSMLGQLSRAAQESGEDSTVWDKMSQLAADDPETAYAVGLQFTTAAYPEEMSKIAQSWKDLGIGGKDRQVHSAENLPGGVSVITYKDGTKEVTDVSGNILTGQTAKNALTAAEELEVKRREAGAVKIPGGPPEETYTTEELKGFQNAVLKSRFERINIANARKALPNAIVGYGANARFEVAKLAQLLFPGNEDINKALTSTRGILQSSAESALGSRFMITGDGQGPATMGEQDLLSRARAGDISFTEPEWQELLNILDRIMVYEEEQNLLDLQSAADAGSKPAKVRLQRLGMPSPTQNAPTNVEVPY
jgi:hypothetical protein